MRQKSKKVNQNDNTLRCGKEGGGEAVVGVGVKWDTYNDNPRGSGEAAGG